jgi:hypothetical protein
MGIDTLYAEKQDTFLLPSGEYRVLKFHKTVPIRVIDTFLLTLYAKPEDAGRVNGAGKYINDMLVTITATAENCYRFVN